MAVKYKTHIKQGMTFNEDREYTVREITDILKIGEQSVFTILWRASKKGKLTCKKVKTENGIRRLYHGANLNQYFTKIWEEKYIKLKIKDIVKICEIEGVFERIDALKKISGY